MSGEIASLGIAVQTGDVTKASTELEKLVQAGEKAEKAAEGISEGFGKASAAASGLAGAETKLAETTEDAKARLLAMAKASLDSSEYLKSLASSVNSSTSAMDAARATTTDFAALNRRLKADADALVGTVEQQAQSTRQAAAATGVQADGLAKLLGQINPAVAALARLDEQQAKLEQYRKTGLIDAETFKDYSARIDSTRKSLSGFDDGLSKTGISARQTEQALRQLPAQFTDIFTSLAGGQNPLMVLIQQGGQIKDSFGGVDNTLTVLRDKFRSLFSGGEGVADLGTSLAGAAANSQDLAESAGEAGDSLSDLAESSNTAAEAAENAQRAVGAIRPAVSGASLSIMGMAAAVIAAAAGLGVLIYGYNKGSQEADEYNKSLILTGNYAGTTAGRLAELALQVSAVNGTTSEAASTLAKLAGSGVIAGESFRTIADAAAAMEDATGRSVDATIAEFVKIAKDPVAAAKELNDQYHFLTASVYSQIVALKEQGDQIGAAKLLTDTYADTVNSRSSQITENLGYIERAWKGITDEAKKSLDAINNIGRQTAPSQRITELTQQVAYGRSAVKADPDDTDAAKKLAFAEKELATLTKLRDTQDKEAKEQALAQAIQDKALNSQIAFDVREKSFRTNKQKRDDELKKLDQELASFRAADPNDPRLEQSRVDQQISNINTRYKDPKVPKGAVGAVDLTEFNASQNAIKTILAEYTNAQKELDALQKAGLVSQEEYGWKRAGLIGNEKDEITAAYEAEIAALESAKARKTTSAAQAVELDKKIADARTDMVKAQQDADSQLKVLAINQEGRLKKQTLAISNYSDALSRQNQALQQAGQRAALGVGQGDRQNALNGELNGIADQANQQRLDLARDKADAARNMSADEYNQKLAAINKSESDLAQTTLSNYEQMSAAQSDWRNGATAAFQNYMDSARDVAGQTKSLFSNAFSSMEDAVVNFAMTGKLSFADFTKSILADMARIASRQAASGILSSLVGVGVSAAGAYFGGGTASAGSTQGGYSPEIMDGWSGIQQAKGGAWDAGVQMFADGGAFTNSIVSKPTAFGMANGKTGVMGEAGEEAIMPLTRTASGKLGVMAVGGGSGTSISLNIPLMVMTDEESGRPDGAELDTEAFQRNMQDRMRVVAKEEIAKSWRQGGVSSRNVKG
ncbi:phage tail tape measure protein [Pseudomonas weihenstephanensis]|uniref:phage tail tape measure protein n=1 Tax=Pseudomonas weihenstephanensis TaxID=1608994 RepID=UPI00193BE331|nr:phage tail tape measure protein [Pseudomonas weihenstephanensis]MBM1191525.1 phage tail tape measure protein [Pseudomonas weihenstephanensis]